MRIRPMTDTHAEAVLAIYHAGIDEGNATFETGAPSWEQFDATMQPVRRSIALPALETSVDANVSVNSTAPGGTSSSSNGVVAPWGEPGRTATHAR